MSKYDTNDILLYMLLAQKGDKKREDSIVLALHTHEMTGPALLAQIKKKDPTISKETFYRVIKKLLHDEVLNKQTGIYQLNRHWLQRIYRFGKKHIETNQGIDPHHILSFEEGDTIRYTFKNSNLMGIYWAHTGDMVFETHDPTIPILVFHRHEWLIHARVSSETFFLSRFNNDQKLVFFTIGGNTELDKQFKKEWRSDYLHIVHNVQYGLNNTDYLNVFGDFIFKVKVSKRFANDIDAFFARYKKITPENRLELQALCERRDTTRMTITRSKKEADKWRMKFKKYFWMPKN